jgi:DNA invertase Pin-like site-specific DNA recombinase
VVVGHSLDRLARCLPDLLETLSEFDRLGIALVAAADGIDTSEATTLDTVRAPVAAVLKAERTVRSEWSSAALDDASENRTKSGRAVGRARFQIDRDQIRALREQGRSYHQIAEQVGAGVATLRRACAESQQGVGAVLAPPGMAFGNAPYWRRWGRP